VDGTVSLGLNPDGPADRQIGLIRLEKPDGAPIAFVMNCAMHGTVLSGKNTLIGGDGSGTVSAYLDQKTGVPVLYVNGAAGDMAPIYSGYDDERRGHLPQFRVLLGDRVLAAARTMGPSTSDVSMSLGEKSIDEARRFQRRVSFFHSSIRDDLTNLVYSRSHS
jgi:neutral ceramidase